MSETNNVVPVVEAVKLTREQKLRAKYDMLVARINKDTETAAEIAYEINSFAALAAIAVGTAVVVKLGRKFSEEKDTTRFVPGVVIGVKEDEDGSKLFKVQHGEGFDADIATVTGAALSLPAAPVQEPAAE